MEDLRRVVDLVDDLDTFEIVDFELFAEPLRTAVAVFDSVTTGQEDQS